MIGVLAACLLLASFPLLRLPVGVGAGLIIAALVACRCFSERAAFAMAR
jgi:hypothetical protein